MPRILSVDDDLDLQQLVAYALRKKGWEVAYAYDGKAGLEKAKEIKPDLILLDMMLPILNGIEVIRALKEDATLRAVPVVVMTAYPSDAQFVQSTVMGLGAVEYLAKPVHVDELVKTIERRLGAQA